MNSSARVEPTGPRPWMRRSAVTANSTASVASHTGRRPRRTPRANPHRASPATIDSATVNGWTPKGSQWSKGWVDLMCHRRAKMTFRAPEMRSTVAATTRTRRRITHRRSTASSRGQVGP